MNAKEEALDYLVQFVLLVQNGNVKGDASFVRGNIEPRLRDIEKQAVQRFIDDLEDYFKESGGSLIAIEGLRRCFKVDYPSEL